MQSSTLLFELYYSTVMATVDTIRVIFLLPVWPSLIALPCRVHRHNKFITRPRTCIQPDSSVSMGYPKGLPVTLVRMLFCTAAGPQTLLCWTTNSSRVHVVVQSVTVRMSQFESCVLCDETP